MIATALFYKKERKTEVFYLPLGVNGMEDEQRRRVTIPKLCLHLIS